MLPFSKMVECECLLQTDWVSIDTILKLRTENDVRYLGSLNSFLATFFFKFFYT